MVLLVCFLRLEVLKDCKMFKHKSTLKTKLTFEFLIDGGQYIMVLGTEAMS